MFVIILIFWVTTKDICICKYHTAVGAYENICDCMICVNKLQKNIFSPVVKDIRRTFVTVTKACSQLSKSVYLLQSANQYYPFHWKIKDVYVTAIVIGSGESCLCDSDNKAVKWMTFHISVFLKKYTDLPIYALCGVFHFVTRNDMPCQVYQFRIPLNFILIIMNWPFLCQLQYVCFDCSCWLRFTYFAGLICSRYGLLTAKQILAAGCCGVPYCEPFLTSDLLQLASPGWAATTGACS